MRRESPGPRCPRWTRPASRPRSTSPTRMPRSSAPTAPVGKYSRACSTSRPRPSSRSNASAAPRPVSTWPSAYAKERVQFAPPDRIVPGDQAQVRRHAARGRAGKSAAYYAAWAARARRRAAPAATLAKAVCTEAYMLGAAENIQIHGGIGFTWEHDAHLYLKRAKSSEILFGDPTLPRTARSAHRHLSRGCRRSRCLAPRRVRYRDSLMDVVTIMFAVCRGDLRVRHRSRARRSRGAPARCGCAACDLHVSTRRPTLVRSVTRGQPGAADTRRSRATPGVRHAMAPHAQGLQPDSGRRAQGIDDTVVVTEDSLTAYLLGESDRNKVDLLDDVDAVHVVEAHLAYFEAIGAIGPQAPLDDRSLSRFRPIRNSR